MNEWLKGYVYVAHIFNYIVSFLRQGLSKSHAAFHRWDMGYMGHRYVVWFVCLVPGRSSVKKKNWIIDTKNIVTSQCCSGGEHWMWIVVH